MFGVLEDLHDVTVLGNVGRVVDVQAALQSSLEKVI